MRLSLVFAGIRARSRACVLAVAGWLVVSGCQSTPLPVPESRPAVLVMENLGNCAWRIDASLARGAIRQVVVPLGETVRLELPAGQYEITQEALAGLEAEASVRHFPMTLASGETYHWRLVTLATVSGDLLR